jgi:hypothetical protein
MMRIAELVCRRSNRCQEGASLLRPQQKPKQNLLNKGKAKNKSASAPSRWSGRSAVGKTQNEETLARTTADAVKQPQVLAAARWPVLG